MLKTLEKSGRTEDEAIQAALMELGLDRDDVSVEILERAKDGKTIMLSQTTRRTARLVVVENN